MQSLADWVAEHYGPADVLLIGLYRAYYERARAGWQRRARAGAAVLRGQPRHAAVRPASRGRVHPRQPDQARRYAGG